MVSKLKARSPPGEDFVRLAGLGQPQWDWLEGNARTRDLVGWWPEGVVVDYEIADLWYERYYSERREQ